MKVSLITVTWNSVSTLEDTIKSVLSQSYKDIEYIIVDGSSTDGTVELIEKWGNQYPGIIRWISEKDKGLYDAMNKGIKMASGDIVGIINSDDFYHKENIVELIVEKFQTTQAEAIYGDVRFVNPENLEKTVRYYSSGFFTPAKFRYGFMPAHPTFFTYKKYFDQLGYYKTTYKIAADYELLIRFLYKEKLKYEYIPTDFLIMRMGGTSTASLKSTYILNKEIVQACRENGIITFMPLLFFKYFVKVFELIFTKN